MGFNSGFKGLSVTGRALMNDLTKSHPADLYWLYTVCHSRFVFAINRLRNVEFLLRSKYCVKLTAFLGPRSFTALSKQPTAGPLPWPRWALSTPGMFFKIRFNNILPFTAKPTKWSLACRFSYQYLYTFLFSPTTRMTQPFHHPFVIVNTIWER